MWCLHEEKGFKYFEHRNLLRGEKKYGKSHNKILRSSENKFVPVDFVCTIHDKNMTIEEAEFPVGNVYGKKPL